jgi:hypothetical protein
VQEQDVFDTIAHPERRADRGLFPSRRRAPPDPDRIARDKGDRVLDERS